jgi:hypothetical protein
MPIASPWIPSLLILTLLTQSCESDPDKQEIKAMRSVYFPAAGCDNGEAIPNFMMPIQGGAVAKCLGSQTADTLPANRAAKISVDPSLTVEIGTVVVRGLSKEQVVLAADSRAGYVGLDGRFNRVEDNACKIAELRPDFLFAVTDMARTAASLPANLYFDAFDLAKEAVANFQFDPDRMQPNTTIKEIAERWAWDVAFRIRRGVNIGIYRPSRAGMWVRGIFAGLEPNGEISTAVAELTYQLPSSWMTAPVVSISIIQDRTANNTTLIDSYGRSAVSERYVSKKGTGESRTEHVRIRKAQLSDPRKFPPEITERLVKLTEQEDDPVWPNGVRAVGGEVDYARLRRGGKVEWLHRKAVCSPLAAQ